MLGRISRSVLGPTFSFTLSISCSTVSHHPLPSGFQLDTTTRMRSCTQYKEKERVEILSELSDDVVPLMEWDLWLSGRVQC